jgi:hypothetical protein
MSHPARLVRSGQAALPGYGLYLRTGTESGMPAMPGPPLRLGPEQDHLDTDDIIHVPVDGRRVTPPGSVPGRSAGSSRP